MIKNNYDSEEYLYLKNIAYLYGFIIRYPKDKDRVTGYYYKPDHLRFVGKDVAKYLTKNNLTLEEYYQWMNKQNKFVYSLMCKINFIVIINGNMNNLNQLSLLI